MVLELAWQQLAAEKLLEKGELRVVKISLQKCIKNKQRVLATSMATRTTPVIKKTFPQIMRLKKRCEFLSIQRRGLRFKIGNLIVIARPAQKTPKTAKIGFTVTKKVGKANVRNLVKRRLRHLSRENFSCWRKYQIVVLARPSSAEATFMELKSDFLAALAQANKKLLKTRISRSKYF